MKKAQVKPLAGVSIHSQHELRKLKRKIVASYKCAGKLAASEKANAAAAVAEAILCGYYLNAAKGLVRHGTWLVWLREHCKGVSESTAQRYMQLSKASHKTDLDDATSLLISAGLLQRQEDRTES